MPYHAVPYHASTSTHTQPLLRFPKPSLAVEVLALAQMLLCSDLATCKPSQGKTRPLARFSHNMLKVGHQAGACGLLGLCKTAWGG